MASQSPWDVDVDSRSSNSTVSSSDQSHRFTEPVKVDLRAQHEQLLARIAAKKKRKEQMLTTSGASETTQQSSRDTRLTALQLPSADSGTTVSPRRGETSLMLEESIRRCSQDGTELRNDAPSNRKAKVTSSTPKVPVQSIERTVSLLSNISEEIQSIRKSDLERGSALHETDNEQANTNSLSAAIHKKSGQSANEKGSRKPAGSKKEVSKPNNKKTNQTTKPKRQKAKPKKKTADREEEPQQETVFPPSDDENIQATSQPVVTIEARTEIENQEQTNDCQEKDEPKKNTREAAKGSQKRKVGVPPTKNKRSLAQSIKEIRQLQQTDQFLIRRLPFMRLVRDIARDFNPSRFQYRFTPDSLEALQTAAEFYLTTMFTDSSRVAAHAKRVTVMPKDLDLLRTLRLIES